MLLCRVTADDQRATVDDALLVSRDHHVRQDELTLVALQPPALHERVDLTCRRRPDQLEPLDIAVGGDR